MTSAETFVTELDEMQRRALEAIAEKTKRPPGGGASAEPPSVARLLLLALKNELEATECAAAWIGSTPEVDVKLALARHAGDEAKHYRLIRKRLGELGVDTSGHDPFAAGRSPLLGYLATLPSTVERVAAGQFTREALALVRNEAFIQFCEAAGDRATAALYADVIQPDERHHHELGRGLLLRLACDEAAQARARAASARVLALADELQEAARLKMGVHCAPGC
jgi:1,2-phenylacetyl-CoA epoxidase catalytic subunit